MYGFPNALIRAAATNVRHGVVDFVVGWLGIFREQRHGGHDLSRLTIAALRHVFRNPGLLHFVCAVGRQSFDGGDLFAHRGGG